MCTKIFLVQKRDGGRAIVAISGRLDLGLLLVEWFKNGESPSEWPSAQLTDDWTRLVVLDTKGLYFYEKYCQKFYPETDRIAFGSGSDFAIGALWYGASAIEAVKIACDVCDSCGFGVDSFSIGDLD